MTALSYGEQLRHIVQMAALSPSVHNSQPWRFTLLPDGLELRADRTHGLAVLDGEGRQLHLSCGSALYHARVVARGLGLNTRVRLLPVPADPTVLARLTITPGKPPRDDELQLAAAILHRHTYRRSFEDDAVPEALVGELRQVAEREGAVLRRISSPEDVIELAVLLDHATRDEERDPAYREELQAWLRTDPTAADGLPIDVVDLTAEGSPVRQRDFTLSHPEHPGAAPRPERPLLLVVGTATDDPEAWLRAGQALAAVLLLAAAHDVQAQPLGQVTDTTGYRKRLQRSLSMVAIPQLVLRMGKAPHVVSATPRRPVDDLISPTGR